MPVDTSIYQNFLRPVKSVQEYDAEAQQAEGNKLGLLLQRGQYDAQQRGVADDAAYRDAVKGFGADTGANANMLRARGLGKQAMDYEKSALEAGKTSAEVANLKKTGAKTDSDLMDASLKRYRAGLDFIETPQGAASWLKAQYEDPALSALMNSRGPFEEAIKHIPQTPAEFNQWRDKVAMGIENYSKKLQEDRKITETEFDHKEHRRIAAGQLGVAQGQLGVARQRLATEQSAPKGQYDPERGVLIDPRTGEAKPVTMGGKPLAPKAKSGPMSVTLQKELIESDDNVQQSASAIAALKKAKTINDKAYSGYGASTRAALVSNLGGSKSADATVELDNLIGNQALSSLKTIFGGNPTEGERAILLDLQASSSKTPTQRTAIIDRAIKAAEVRAKYAGSKAQSIRSGKYLTEGAPAMGADDDIHSQADAILRGGK